MTIFGVFDPPSKSDFFDPFETLKSGVFDDPKNDVFDVPKMMFFACYKSDVFNVL